MASYGARQADGPASHCALVQRTAARWSRHPTAVFRPALRAGLGPLGAGLQRLTRHSGRAETKSELPGQTNLGVSFLPKREAQRRHLRSQFASSAVLDFSLTPTRQRLAMRSRRFPEPWTIKFVPTVNRSSKVSASGLGGGWGKEVSLTRERR
jgi:hypothetical protein